jgi:hypothetical protein
LRVLPSIEGLRNCGLRDLRADLFFNSLIHNPDKPEKIATKAPRHKEELFIII